MEHGQLILGRSNKGKGTLSYKVDEVGVLFWADMPRTADGDKALELIARGDILPIVLQELPVYERLHK